MTIRASLYLLAVLVLPLAAQAQNVVVTPSQHGNPQVVVIPPNSMTGLDNTNTSADTQTKTKTTTKTTTTKTVTLPKPHSNADVSPNVDSTTHSQSHIVGEDDGSDE